MSFDISWHQIPFGMSTPRSIPYIFNQNANLFALGLRVGYGCEHEHIALPITTCWYSKGLTYLLNVNLNQPDTNPNQHNATPNASWWNVVLEQAFMLFVPFLFALCTVSGGIWDQQRIPKGNNQYMCVLFPVWLPCGDQRKQSTCPK